MKKKKEQTLLDKITFSFDKIILGNIILTVLFLIFGIIVYLNCKISNFCFRYLFNITWNI